MLGGSTARYPGASNNQYNKRGGAAQAHRTVTQLQNPGVNDPVAGPSYLAMVVRAFILLPVCRVKFPVLIRPWA